MRRKFLVLGLVVAGLSLTNSYAMAFGRKCCKEECAPACAYEDKVVTAYKTEWRERDVTVTVNRVHTREVVENKKVTVHVPTYTEEKRLVNVTKTVNVCVEKPVTTTKRVRQTVVDPCTGCCKKQWCKVECVEMKKCTVKQCVTEQKEVCVKVCKMVPEERTISCKRIVCETKPETVVRKEKYCVQVPYQTTVKVPVSTSCCGTTVSTSASCCH